MAKDIGLNLVTIKIKIKKKVLLTELSFFLPVFRWESYQKKLKFIEFSMFK